VARVRAGNTPQKMVLRALIVLMAADGASNATIAEELGVCVDTARKWRARFCANGIEGLADAPRSGRPPEYSAGEVARVKAWAYTTADLNRHLERLDQHERATQAA
jgi:transposase